MIPNQQEPGRTEPPPIEDLQAHAVIGLSDELHTGSIFGIITAQTPIHVGTGQSASRFFTVSSVPTIPGSSLKGAIRSLFELITYSCFPHQDSGPYQRCAENKPTSEFCPACKVFGGLGYAGRLYFHPAKPPTATQTIVIGVPIQPARSPISDPGTTRRVFEHVPLDTSNQRSVEVLDTGTELNFRLDFRSMRTDELGLLLIVLGQDPNAPIYPKVGALKAHGYGVVKITMSSIKTWQRQSFQEYEMEQKGLSADIPTIVEKAFSHPGFYQDGYDLLKEKLGQAAFEASQ